jgi:hypothetical protein
MVLWIKLESQVLGVAEQWIKVKLPQQAGGSFTYKIY